MQNLGVCLGVLLKETCIFAVYGSNLLFGLQYSFLTAGVLTYFIFRLNHLRGLAGYAHGNGNAQVKYLKTIFLTFQYCNLNNQKNFWLQSELFRLQA